MNTASIDPKEQAFIEHALAAANRSQRRDRVREIVMTVLVFAALAWFASRPSGPALGIEVTICLVLGTALGAMTAKLRSLIQRNTVLVLQAIQRIQPPARELPSPDTKG